MAQLLNSHKFQSSLRSDMKFYSRQHIFSWGIIFLDHLLYNRSSYNDTYVRKMQLESSTFPLLFLPRAGWDFHIVEYVQSLSLQANSTASMLPLFSFNSYLTLEWHRGQLSYNQNNKFMHNMKDIYFTNVGNQVVVLLMFVWGQLQNMRNRSNSATFI